MSASPRLAAAALLLAAYLLAAPGRAAAVHPLFAGEPAVALASALLQAAAVPGAEGERAAAEFAEALALRLYLADAGGAAEARDLAAFYERLPAEHRPLLHPALSAFRARRAGRGDLGEGLALLSAFPDADLAAPLPAMTPEAADRLGAWLRAAGLAAAEPPRAADFQGFLHGISTVRPLLFVNPECYQAWHHHSACPCYYAVKADWSETVDPAGKPYKAERGARVDGTLFDGSFATNAVSQMYYLSPVIVNGFLHPAYTDPADDVLRIATYWRDHRGVLLEAYAYSRFYQFNKEYNTKLALGATVREKALAEMTFWNRYYKALAPVAGGG